MSVNTDLLDERLRRFEDKTIPGDLDSKTIMSLQDKVPQAEIKWRQANYDPGKKTRMLAYVDARYVMDTLDRCLGNENWTTDYLVIKDRLFCKLTVTLPSGREVTKMDCGAETTFEAEKGVVSDAFKRAAVLFGIGRDLYSLGEHWAETNERGYVPREWSPPLVGADSSQGLASSGPATTEPQAQQIPAPIPPNKDQGSPSVSPVVEETEARDFLDEAYDNRFQEKETKSKRVAFINPPPPEGRSESPSAGEQNTGKNDGAELVVVGDLTAFSDPELNKAIWVGVAGEGDDKKHWIPKSQIDEHTFNGKHSTGAIFIPKWLAKKNVMAYHTIKKS